MLANPASDLISGFMGERVNGASLTAENFMRKNVVTVY